MLPAVFSRLYNRDSAWASVFSGILSASYVFFLCVCVKLSLFMRFIYDFSTEFRQIINICLSPSKTPATMSKKSSPPSDEQTIAFIAVTVSLGRPYASRIC